MSFIHYLRSFYCDPENPDVPGETTLADNRFMPEVESDDDDGEVKQKSFNPYPSTVPVDPSTGLPLSADDVTATGLAMKEVQMGQRER